MVHRNEMTSSHAMQSMHVYEVMRRLGIDPPLLYHHAKILMHIKSHLDRAFAAIKLAADFLV
jgi:hypothetical protein